jgi:hypothetical protein
MVSWSAFSLAVGTDFTSPRSGRFGPGRQLSFTILPQLNTAKLIKRSEKT